MIKILKTILLISLLYFISTDYIFSQNKISKEEYRVITKLKQKFKVSQIVDLKSNPDEITEFPIKKAFESNLGYYFKYDSIHSVFLIKSKVPGASGINKDTSDPTLFFLFYNSETQQFLKYENSSGSWKKLPFRFGKKELLSKPSAVFIKIFDNDLKNKGAIKIDFYWTSHSIFPMFYLRSQSDLYYTPEYMFDLSIFSEDIVNSDIPGIIDLNDKLEEKFIQCFDKITSK